MKHNMFTVYDSKAEMYTLPYFASNEAMGRRHFETWINDSKHTFGLHPADYTLYTCGEYEDNTATITQEKIISLGNGLEYLKGENNEVS